MQTRTIQFEQTQFNVIQHLSLPDRAEGVPKTTMYRVINSMLDLACQRILNDPLDFLESWELEVAIDSLHNHQFQELEPSILWTFFLKFNENLALKIKSLNHEQQLTLLLKILYERKKTD